MTPSIEPLIQEIDQILEGSIGLGKLNRIAGAIERAITAAVAKETERAANVAAYSGLKNGKEIAAAIRRQEQSDEG